MLHLKDYNIIYHKPGSYNGGCVKFVCHKTSDYCHLINIRVHR